MNNFKKISDLIHSSPLSPISQEELLAVFSLAKDEDLAETAQLFESDATWIQKIFANYQAKKSALNLGDEKLWQTIVSIEEKELSAIKD